MGLAASFAFSNTSYMCPHTNATSQGITAIIARKDGENGVVLLWSGTGNGYNRELWRIDQTLYFGEAGPTERLML